MKPTTSRVRWTNPSVLKLLAESGNSDPILAITTRVRQIVLSAIDDGWAGPPFDPLALADHLRLTCLPRGDIRDAQTVPAEGGHARIEFNPGRPRSRVRYSIAHEIAHTVFPDCLEQVRERAIHSEIRGDDWQLEALCNIGAAEILMPFGSLADLPLETIGMRRALELRDRFDVSMEALLIRLAQLSDTPIAAFCASRVESGKNRGRYRLDYALGSPRWSARRARGVLLPAQTVLAGCSVLGFTASGSEQWGLSAEPLAIEAVAIAPYPGSGVPRVVGLARPSDSSAATGMPCLEYVRGDATKVRGQGRRFVVQVVNDKTPNWGGGGFATAVRRSWPAVQDDFLLWAKDPGALRLGNTRVYRLGASLSVASIVAQKGYGPSAFPRIRYAALEEGLTAVAATARRERASIHMPRIGTGNAGGAWPVIEDIVRWTCCQQGLKVLVYDLPESKEPTAAGQPTFSGLLDVAPKQPE